MAEIHGKSDKFVLFSGHVDSWYYGAMDNASANAVMIEVAKLFQTIPTFLREALGLHFGQGTLTDATRVRPGMPIIFIMS